MEIGLFKWLGHDRRAGLHAKNIALQEAEEKEAFEREFEEDGPQTESNQFAQR
jgi:hypothetical protein